MRNDFAYAVSSMLHNKGVFAVAVITLALGIGANTAVFSVVHGVLLRPLPVKEPDRLVTIWARIPSMNIEGAFVEYNTFAEFWRARNRSFESLAAYTPAGATFSQGDQPERVNRLRVSANYFSVIGVNPVLGRDFIAEEDQPGARRVAILSHGLWMRRFGGNAGVLGRPIVLDRNDYTVVGVMGPDFDLDETDVYLPIAESTTRRRGEPSVGAYGRLRRGVTLEAAQADIDRLCHEWVQKYGYPRDWGARVWRMHDHMVRGSRPGIVLLSVAVALVLLIACANVANLLLARAGARRREIAIRGALGAGRGRIVRQLLTESALLGGVAAGLGLLLAWTTVRALVAAEVAVPFVKRLAVNGPALWFTAAVAVLTTLLFGLVPGLTAARTGLAENLKDSGRGLGESVRRAHFRNALMVGEVALALLLVIGASLTIRSLARLQAVNPGFNAESVLTAQVMLPEASYADPGRRAAFFKMLHDRVAALPGVQSVGLVSDLPFGGSKSGNDVVPEGAAPPTEGEKLIAFVRTVDADYFRALQVPLRRGRYFTEHDSPVPPVAIVNESMARRCWPNQDAVGKRFGAGRRVDTWITVVGVVGDVHSSSLTEPPDLEYFLPQGLMPPSGMALAVRTGLDPVRLASGMRAAVRELDKELPISEIHRLTGDIAHTTSSQRFSVMLLSAFAGLALLLAAIGIYGVISYSVSRRTHEIGVRMALGAGRSRIAGMVVGGAVLLGGIGVMIGVGGGLVLTRLLRSMLFGVSATDLPTFAGASLFLLAVTAAGACLPARRAARVDPVVALHEE